MRLSDEQEIGLQRRKASCGDTRNQDIRIMVNWGIRVQRSTRAKGQSAEGKKARENDSYLVKPFDPSAALQTPNDGRSLSFDYTQDRFGTNTGQAGQAFLLRINF